MKSILVKEQKRAFWCTGTAYGEKADILVKVRYDDQCGNGHNSFSITGEAYKRGKPRTDRNLISCGCIHDIIKENCKNMAPFIKWHIMTSEGPMYYVANTIYHAKDVDCNGLKKGEFQSFTYKVKVGDKTLFKSRIFYSFRNWLHEKEAKAESLAFMSNIKTELNPQIIREGSGQPSEGKPSDLEAARACAIWPDATIEQLQDEEALKKRLPALIAEFKTALDRLGFVY